MIDKIINAIKKTSPILIAIVLIVVGIGGIIGGELLNGAIANILKTLGVTLLASGAFSAFLKALQATGVFQEELSKVIYSPEFLARMQNLLEIWKTVTAAIHSHPCETPKTRKE